MSYAKCNLFLKDASMIRGASESDVGGIVSLANRLARTDSLRQKDNNGFLVPYSEAEYRKFVAEADFNYVLFVDGRFSGFLLAYSSHKIDQFGGEVYDYINRTQKGSYLVVRQVCIAPELSHKGLGTKLYNHLFEAATKNSKQFSSAFCFIWKNPPNSESERFHKALGWREIETYHLINGDGEVGIWKYTLVNLKQGKS